MVRRLYRHLELCPDCGHHMAKNKWSCSFCGWSIYDPNRDDFIEETDYSGWFSKDEKHEVGHLPHWYHRN
jgi:tRNA(Ile2) C34 agmatinyltransferase TiaS